MNFEDDTWESAGYRSGSTAFFSGKIGWKEFCDVVTAVRVLYELYDDDMGYARIDGKIVEASPYVGWINHVLGKNFSLKHRFCLWELFEKYCLKRMELGYDDPAGSYDIMDIIPSSLSRGLGGTELADICYMTKGTDSLQEEEIVSGSYPKLKFQCRELLKQYFDGRKNSEDDPGQNIRKLDVCIR